VVIREKPIPIGEGREGLAKDTRID